MPVADVAAPVLRSEVLGRLGTAVAGVLMGFRVVDQVSSIARSSYRHWEHFLILTLFGATIMFLFPHAPQYRSGSNG